MVKPPIIHETDVDKIGDPKDYEDRDKDNNWPEKASLDIKIPLRAGLLNSKDSNSYRADPNLKDKEMLDQENPELNPFNMPDEET